MSNIFVKPAVDSAVVPDEVTHRPLAAAGEWKPRTAYWVRRLRDGDVVEAEPPKDETAEAKSPRTTKRS